MAPGILTKLIMSVAARVIPATARVIMSVTVRIMLFCLIITVQRVTLCNYLPKLSTQ